MPLPWRYGLCSFALAVLAGLAMVTSESLWIDEGQTLLFARQLTFHDWAEQLLHSTKSEAQMPLGMFVAWIGGQTLGLGEWQLRAVNLLWVGLAGVAISLVGRLLQQPSLFFLFLLHPFLWFYANEARPYAVQICASAWLLYVLIRAHTNATLNVTDTWLFGLAAIVGYGSSLLFAFGLIGALVGAALIWRQGKLRSGWKRGHWFPLAFTLALLGALTLYYLYTLSRGAAGAKIWKLSPINLGFAFYELLGFSGLGPPRNELRELARNPSQFLNALLQLRYLAGLGLVALLYLFVAARLWKLRLDALVLWIISSMAATVVSLFAAATVVQFPFWGRHLAPILPFTVLLVGKLASSAGNDPGRLGRYGLTLLLTGCLTISSLSLRFGPEYRKDDYRGASELAKAAFAAGKVVWWSADPQECAAYYGLSKPELPSPLRSQFVFCYNASANDIKRWPAPDIILQSKPDIHDVHGTLQVFLSANPFRVAGKLSAFSIWEKSNDNSVRP